MAPSRSGALDCADADRPSLARVFGAKDKREACFSVEAGVNIELPEPDCYLHLVDLVRRGELKEKQLDDLVASEFFSRYVQSCSPSTSVIKQ